MCVVTTRALVDWYRTCARDLPWRSEPRDPYLVLVSEIMLQQTQVDRVAPRFASFVERFPTFADLAAATEDEVLTAWSGLGYYRRGRNLHRLAREVAAGAGCLPRMASDLERLPGIGPYTAAAVASLAFGEAVPVLDGNVMRVGARVLAMETDPRSAAGRRRLETWVVGLMEGAPPGQVNEALMELGAVVCRPVDPDCAVCPFADRCGAKAEGRPEAYPPPRRRRAQVALRWVAACCVDREGAWLLRRIDEGPILRGLWLPPLAELEDWTGHSPPHHPPEDRRCPGADRGRLFRSTLRELAMGGSSKPGCSDILVARKAHRIVCVRCQAEARHLRRALRGRVGGNSKLKTENSKLKWGGSGEEFEIRNSKSEICDGTSGGNSQFRIPNFEFA